MLDHVPEGAAEEGRAAELLPKVEVGGSQRAEHTVAAFRPFLGEVVDEEVLHSPESRFHLPVGGLRFLDSRTWCWSAYHYLIAPVLLHGCVVPSRLPLPKNSNSIASCPG